MPIMSAHGESDARVAAWLLATTAWDCLRAPAQQPLPEVALNNVYRLLEAAKLNPFFGRERDQARTAGSLSDPVFLSHARERHVREVRSALDSAIKATYQDESPEAAIESVEMVLKGLAYPEQFGAPSAHARSKAAQFFERLVHQLKYA